MTGRGRRPDQSTFSPGVGRHLRELVAGYVDTDGDMDLAATGQSPNLVMLLNNGDAMFEQDALVYGVEDVGTDLVTAGFNNDGRPDFASGNGMPVLSLTTFEGAVSVLPNRSCVDVFPGEVDGEGDLADLAASLAAYNTWAGDPGYNPDADLDDNGCVDLSDLTALLANNGHGT